MPSSFQIVDDVEAVFFAAHFQRRADQHRLDDARGHGIIGFELAAAADRLEFYFLRRQIEFLQDFQRQPVRQSPARVMPTARPLRSNGERISLRPNMTQGRPTNCEPMYFTSAPVAMPGKVADAAQVRN